jgi:NADH:ubiquinone oxidoreductase subunit 4 (subunit M)
MILENTPLSLTSVGLFAPLVGLLVTLFLPPKREEAIRWLALATTVITFVLTVAWPCRSTTPTRPCSSPPTDRIPAGGSATTSAWTA